MIWADVRYFRVFEFDSPDARGSGVNMNDAFILKLDKLRDAVKIPLVIRSGYRTEEHNARVGGVDSSAHTSGHAADIAALSSSTKFKIMEAAMRLGFRRLGIGATFIHIDDDITKSQDVCWLYPATEKRG